jgi:HEAT repeat protein
MKLTPVALAWLILAVPAHASLDPISEAEDLRQVDAPALKAGSESRDAGIRARVARAYGRIQQADGIAPLEALLRDKSEKVRVEAAFALGQFGWKAQFAGGREGEITGALATALSVSGEHKSVRLAIIEAIGKVGLALAPDKLAASLDDEDAEIRAETLMALFRYRQVLGLRSTATPSQPPTVPDSLLPRVLALAKDRSAEVRQNVAFEFAQIRDTRTSVTPVMVALATDPSYWVRYFAVSALQEATNLKSAPADPKAIAAALKAASDSHYEVRTAAVGALGAMGALSQLSVTKVAQDPAWEVRSAYATAAGSTTPAMTIADLQSLNADPSPTVQTSLLDARVAIDKAGADTILKAAAQDASWLVRAEAALDTQGIDESIALDAAAKDPNVVVRSNALQTLQTYKDAQAFAAIKNALASQLPAENGAASSALAGRAEPEIPQLAWQYYQYWSGPQWEDVRANLLAPLVATVTPQTTAWLTQALSDPADEVVQTAYAGLQARNAPDLGPEKDPPFTHSPYEGLTFRRDPTVVLETNKGKIEIRCFARSAPTLLVAPKTDCMTARPGIAWLRILSFKVPRPTARVGETRATTSARRSIVNATSEERSACRELMISIAEATRYSLPTCPRRISTASIRVLARWSAAST